MALTAGLVLHILRQGFVVAVKQDIRMAIGILIKRNARLKYAALGIDNWKHAPTVANISRVK